LLAEASFIIFSDVLSLLHIESNFAALTVKYIVWCAEELVIAPWAGCDLFGCINHNFIYLLVYGEAILPPLLFIYQFT
jgi:hypothetical protein